MVKKKNFQTAGKATLAASLLASTVVPYSITASADTVTMTTAAEITAALTVLDPTSADYVANVEKIIAAYDLLPMVEKVKITTANKTKITNHTEAIVIVKAINELPTVEEIAAIPTTDELASLKGEISSIRGQYTAAKTTSRTLIKNYATLTLLEKAITNQTTYLNSVPLLKNWFDAVKDLPKLINLTGVTAADFAKYTDEQKYTDDDLAKITLARAEYNKLTTALKSYAKDGLATLVAIEAQVKLQTPLVKAVLALEVAKFTKLVDELNPAAENYPEAVENVNKVFEEDLDSAVQAGITTTTKTKITNHTHAATLVKGIKDLPTVEVISTADAANLETYKNTVTKLRASYSASTTVQRSYVTNLATLAAAEAAVTLRQTTIKYDETLKDWKDFSTQIKDLKLKDFTLVFTATQFGALPNDDKYSADELKLLTDARSEYNRLTSEVKKYEGTERIEVLTKHEEAAKRQATLTTALTALTLEVDNFKSQITNLGGVANFEDVTGATYVEKYNATAIQAILDARIAAGKLSVEAILLVEDELEILGAHEAAVLQQKKLVLDAAAHNALMLTVDNFKSAITALGIVVDFTDVTGATYEKEETIKYNATALQAIVAARTVAIGLSADATALVADELSTLGKHVAAVLQQEQLVLDAAAHNALVSEGQSFKEAITALRAPVDFSAATAKNYKAETTDKYTDTELQSIIAARALTVGLSEGATALVADGLSTLGKHEVAAVKQGQLVEASKFVTTITALGDVVSFTGVTAATYKDTDGYNDTALLAIKNARTAVIDLSTEAKALLTNELSTLGEHEAAAVKQGQLAEASKFVTTITALGTVVDFTGVTAADYEDEDTDKYTDTVLEAIVAARSAANGLSTEAKALLTNELSTLGEHEAAAVKQGELVLAVKAAKQQAATDYTDAVNDLDGLTEVADYITEVGKIKTDAALTPDVVALLSNGTKTKIKNHRAAANVVDLISKINVEAIEEIIDGIVENVGDSKTTLETLNGPVTTARAAYKLLTAAEKALVDKFNYDVLTDAENTVAETKDAITEATALAPFKAEMAKLSEFTVPNIYVGLSYKSTLVEVKKYSETHVTAINEALKLYDKLLPAYKELENINTAHTSLTGHKSALDLQEKLVADIEAYTKVEDRVEAFETAVTALNSLGSPAGTPLTFGDLKTLASDTPIYDTDAKGKITTAKELYDGLVNNTDTALNVDAKFINEALVQKMQGFVNSLSTQVNLEIATSQGLVKALIDKIERLSTLTDLTARTADVDDAKTKYQAYVTANDQAALTTLAPVKATLDNHVAAMPVIQKIADLSNDYLGVDGEDTKPAVTIPEGMDTYINAAKAARDAYKLLDSGAKALVITTNLPINLATLTAYETAVANKKVELQIKEALTNWNAAYNAINAYDDTITFTEDGFDYKTHVNGADDTGKHFYNTTADLDKITAARTAYTNIDEGYETHVDPAELEHLEKVEQIRDRYDELKTAQLAAEKNRADAITGALKDFVDAMGAITTTIDGVTTYPTLDAWNGTEPSAYSDLDKIRTAIAAYEAAPAKFTGIISNTDFEAEADDTLLALIEALIPSVEAYDLLVAAFDNKAAITTALTDWSVAFGAITFNVKYAADAINAGNVDTDIYVAYDTDQLKVIKDARTAYDALKTNTTVPNINLQDHVKTDDYKKLTDLEASRDAYITAKNAKIQANKAEYILKLAEDITALKSAEADYLTKFAAVQNKVVEMGPDIKGEFDTAKPTQAKLLTNHTAVVEVVKLINAAGTEDTITKATTLTALATIEDKIQKARDAYDDALTDDQKALLVDTAIVALESAASTKRTALEKAESVKDWTAAFNALPEFIDFTGLTYEELASVTTYTTEQIKKIEALRGLYETYALLGVQRNVPVPEFDHLVKLENDVKRQKGLETELALKDWTAAFTKLLAIPIPDFTGVTVDNVTTENFSVANKYAPSAEALIDAAANAYVPLGDVLKLSIATDYAKLEAHQEAWDLQVALQKALDDKLAAASKQQKLDAFTDALAALQPANDDYVAKFNTAKSAYEALQTANLVDELTEDQTTSYANHTAAVAVVSAITAASNGTKINEASTKDALDEINIALTNATLAYNKLNDTPKKYVTNYEAIATAEKKVGDKLKALEQTGAISQWTTAFTQLPTKVLSFTDVTYKTIEDALTYSDSEIEKINALRKIYAEDYDETIKGYVPEAQLNTLIAHEAAVKTQKALQYQAENAATDLDNDNLKAWKTAFEKLPAVINTTSLTAENYATFDKYPDGTAQLVKDAETALGNLDENLRKSVLPAEIQKITDLEASLAKFASVGGDAAKLKAWQTAFGKLPAVINTTSLTAENYATFTKYPDGTAQLVEDAETALGGLDDNLRKSVSQDDIQKITDLKASLAKFDSVGGDAAKLTAWKTAFKKLPTYIDTTSLTPANYATFDKYPANTATLVVKADAELAKLSNKVKEDFVSAEDIKLISDFKISLAKFISVEAQIAAANEASVYLDVIKGIEGLSTANIQAALTIQAAYDKLSAADKAKISASLVQKLTNHVTAANLLTRIAALPTAEAIKAINNSADFAPIRHEITSIRAAYVSTTTVVRSYVTTYSSLTAIETALTAQEKLLASQEALLLTWNPAINALLELDLITFNPETYTEADGYSANAVSIITTARDVYNKLSTDVKSVIDRDDLSKLIAFENSLVTQKNIEASLVTQKVATFTSLVDALDPTAADYVTKVGDVTTAYGKLSPDVVAKLTTTTITKKTNHEIAALVVHQINEIALGDDVAAYKDAVNAARTAYGSMTTVQRSYVKNLAVLVAHERIAKTL